MEPHQIIETERVGALEEHRLASVLAQQDPSWGTTLFAIADGLAVLSGAGLFVNQCMAAGLTEPITTSDLDLVLERAAEVGVTPAFECCDATRPDAVALLEAHGWTIDDRRSVLVHDLRSLPEPVAGIDVGLVAADDLGVWQDTSASGWGHTAPTAIAANHAMAAAAFVSDEPGLLLARDARTGAALGCAALRMTDGIATLGGMSTLPAARRRGVQSTLIAWRLRCAADHGCRYAVSMTEPASGSERNLRRLGFSPAYVKTRWARVG